MISFLAIKSTYLIERFVLQQLPQIVHKPQREPSVHSRVLHVHIAKHDLSGKEASENGQQADRNNAVHATSIEQQQRGEADGTTREHIRNQIAGEHEESERVQ